MPNLLIKITAAAAYPMDDYGAYKKGFCRQKRVGSDDDAVSAAGIALHIFNKFIEYILKGKVSKGRAEKLMFLGFKMFMGLHAAKFYNNPE